MSRRHKPRRGVVLLVVLTLLTLLLVVGLTLTVLSGHFRRAAEANARKNATTMTVSSFLTAPCTNWSGTRPADSRSPLKGHSLLGDLYGNDGVAGVVDAWTQQVGGEFLEIAFSALPLARQPFGNSFRTQPGYYNGCTLTILGPVYSLGPDNQPGRAGVDDDGANGTDDLGELGWPSSDDIATVAESARVVRYNTNPIPSVVVEWSPGEGGTKAFPRPGGTVPFLINGRPFNGTGAGYKSFNTADPPATYGLDAIVPGVGEVALLPNYSAYPVAPTDPPDEGGLDESWDAVDYQNMFLAMVPPDPSVGIIPSFHRPALVNFWIKRFGMAMGIADPTTQVSIFRYPYGPDGLPGTGDDPVDGAGNPIPPSTIIQLKRMIIPRPLPEDHPGFVNGPQFTNTMGLPNLSQMIWDVDNDGDGIPDSVWTHFGQTVQTDASGRRYVPLVAILCEDLDGRLNVNAHSSPAHRSDLYASSGVLQSSPALTDPMMGIPTPLPFASLPPLPPQPVLVPRGLGVGPADIFLGHLFNPVDFANLLTQRYLHDVTVSGNAGGISDIDDPTSLIKSLGIPRNFATTYSAYGMPPDLWGRGGIGVDYTGQPIVFYMGEAGETVGDPYEMVLNRRASGYTDAPFTVAELERILRFEDADAFGLARPPVDQRHQCVRPGRDPQRCRDSSPASEPASGNHSIVVTCPCPAASCPPIGVPVLPQTLPRLRRTASSTCIDVEDCIQGGTSRRLTSTRRCSRWCRGKSGMASD